MYACELAEVDKIRRTNTVLSIFPLGHLNKTKTNSVIRGIFFVAQIDYPPNPVVFGLFPLHFKEVTWLLFLKDPQKQPFGNN